MNDQGFLLLFCTPYCRREMDERVLIFFHWTIQTAISLAKRTLDNAFNFRVVVKEE